MSAYSVSSAESQVFSVDWVQSTLAAIGGQVIIPGRALSFAAVATDTRNLPPGCLFLALRGDRFDAHAFTAQAIRSGASGVLIEAGRFPELRQDLEGLEAWVFTVPDMSTALRTLGMQWRKRFPKLPVIGVAGSVGKTTTKEMLAALLTGKFGKAGVLKTLGSQNGFVGIPLTLLNLRSHHQAAVIEIGIDEPGTMKGHIETVQTTVSLLTAIAPEHLEKLIDLETVAREEAIALEETLRLGGKILINADDSWIGQTTQKLEGLRVHLETPAAPSDWQAEIQGPSLSVRGFEASAETVSFDLPLPGIHHARNLLLALAAARAVGLSVDEARTGLASFEAASGRTDVRRLRDGTTAICDYYNANPASMRAGLSVLAELAEKQRAPERWACLADMLELGPHEAQFHRDLAPALQDARVDGVLLYGPRMRALAETLSSASHWRPATVAHFESQAALGAALAARAKTGAIILIKGSRGMKMETAWEAACTQRSDWGFPAL